MWCTTRLYTGPLLFVIYINDLQFVCEQTFPVSFSNYSDLFLSGKNIDHVQQMMNDEQKILLFG